MNTKGTRFLAVVAVMALAFTLFVALDPADENMGDTPIYGIDVYDWDDDIANPEEVTSSTGSGVWTGNNEGFFYVSEDTTVKMKGMPADQDELTFLVQNGATLTLDFKKSWDATKPINIYTVTGDQQELLTTSDVVAEVGADGKGKVAIESTLVTFTTVAGKGMSVYYSAALMDFDVDYQRDTIRNAGFDLTVEPEVDRKAYFSADDALTEFEAESDVAVAPGQTIEISSDSADLVANLEYGVVTVDYSTANTTYTATYYSVGANVGDFVLSDNDDAVYAIAGKVTAKNGDNSIKVNKWKENKDDDSVTKITKGTNCLTIGNGDDVSGATENEPADQMGAGEITVNGNVKFDGYYFSDGTVSVSNKVNIQENSTVGVDGTLILKNASADNLTVYGTGTLKLTNSDIWEDEPTDGIKATITDFGGLVDTADISKVARMEKDISSSDIKINQTFELFGNTTVSKALEIQGILIVDEGVTLTIDKGAKISLAATAAAGNYAQIINYGKIVIKAEVYGEGLFVDSGKVFNYGTIQMASKSNLGDDPATSTLYSAGLGIKNFGTIDVSKSDLVELKKFENTADGKLTMNGKVFADSTITNKGRVVFNGTDLKTFNAGIVINNKGLSASTYVSSIDIGTNAKNKVVISDVQSSFYNADNEIYRGNSAVEISVLSGDTTSTVRGLTVAASVDADDYPQMVVSGGVTRSSTNTDAVVEVIFKNGKSTKTGNVAKAGNFVVDDSLSFGKNIQWTIGTGNGSDTTKDIVKVVVNGALTMNKDAAFELANATDEYKTVGKFYAYGRITCNENDFFSPVQYVGAKVVDADGDTFFMPLEDAVAFATLNDIDAVDVGYIDNNDVGDDPEYTTVLRSFDVPAGMTVQTVGQHFTDGDIPKI